MCNSDFSSSDHSTSDGATTRDPVRLLCIPRPLTELLPLYYLHCLSEARLLSYPHHLLWVHGLVLKWAATPYLLQTLPSCHTTPSEKSLDTHSGKKTELLINALRSLHMRTDRKLSALAVFT